MGAMFNLNAQVNVWVKDDNWRAIFCASIMLKYGSVNILNSRVNISSILKNGTC